MLYNYASVFMSTSLHRQSTTFYSFMHFFIDAELCLIFALCITDLLLLKGALMFATCCLNDKFLHLYIYVSYINVFF